VAHGTTSETNGRVRVRPASVLSANALRNPGAILSAAGLCQRNFHKTH
jgi:hypothetical protein